MCEVTALGYAGVMFISVVKIASGSTSKIILPPLVLETPTK